MTEKRFTPIIELPERDYLGHRLKWASERWPEGSPTVRKYERQLAALGEEPVSDQPGFLDRSEGEVGGDVKGNT